MRNEIPVVISGLGQCSAVGQGLDSLRAAWLDNRAPQVQLENVATRQGAVSISVLRAAAVTMPRVVPEAVERRMSRFSKMCFATVAEALTDCVSDRSPERVGLIVGTAFGSLNLANDYQKRVIKDGPAGASPSLFAASIHNSLAAQLTLAFGLQGANSTVSTMEQTPVGAMRLGYDWIQQGMVDRVVVLIADELSEYLLYYLAHRQGGAIPGEGTVAFVLEREDDASKRYAQMQAPCLFVESHQDADHLYGPKTHVHLFGSMVAGLAFEMALAVLNVERAGGSTACLQSTADLGNQSVIFKK